MRKSAAGPKIRWGIIGAGKIARWAIAPAIRYSNNGVLQGVASRNGKKADELAAELTALQSFASYEALIASPTIDAIYIGLPNGLHEEWTLKAAAAGKHVLCEKSLTMTSASAEKMRDACRRADVLLMEAFMYRHHPQWDHVRAAISSGSLGAVRSIHGIFVVTLGNDEDHRWSEHLGGGSLYDLACYPINAARFLLEAEPTRVTALADLTGEQRVDRSIHVSMIFPQKILVTAIGSLVGNFTQSLTVVGTDATLQMRSPFAPNFDEAAIHISRASGTEEIIVGGANHYLHMVEHFAASVLDGARALEPAEDGVANVKVLEAALRSARISGSPVDIT